MVGVSFLNLFSDKRDWHLAVSACSRAAFWTWVPPFLLTSGPFLLSSARAAIDVERGGGKILN